MTTDFTGRPRRIFSSRIISARCVSTCTFSSFSFCRDVWQHDFTNEPFRPTTVNPAVWFFTSMPIVTSACSGVASTKGQKLFVSNTLFKATLRRYPVKRLRWLSLTS